MKTHKSNLVFYFSIGFCVLCFGYFVFESFFFPPHDYVNSYFGAYLFLNDTFDLSIFDPYSFNKKIYDLGFRNIYASYNPNPPFTALFFIPLSLLPLAISKLLFNVITSALFLLTIFRLCKQQQVSPTVVFLLLPLLFFLPLYYEILFGQTYLLIFVLLVEGYISYDQKRLLLTSVLWGLAIMLKVFPAIIILLLLFKKDWKTMLYVGSITVILLLVSIAVMGFDIWEMYLFEILPQNSVGRISSEYTTNYQSALMLFKHLFVEEAMLNPHPLVNSIKIYQLSLVLTKGIVIALCVMMILDRQNLLSFGFLCLGAILFSPYSSTYGNLLLLIVFIASLKDTKPRNIIIVIILIFLISNLPISLFKNLPALFRFPRFGLLFCLFIYIFIRYEIKWNWRVLIVFIILFSSTLVFKQSLHENDTSRRILSNEDHTLIFDYGSEDGFIFYKHWSDTGENIFKTTIPSIELKQQGLSIVNNQLMYRGTQLTHSRDRKLKPMLLDGKSVLYLSDKNKGMGFYTIRRIDL